MSDSHILRPYGDTTGDGMVQLSFTLPMANSKVAEGAAAQLANKMGMDPALVVHAKAMGPDFTFFVVYGRVNHLVDTSKVVRSSSVTTRCWPPRRSTWPSARACADASWWWAAASAPTPTPSGSTRSSTSRGSPGRRDWSTTASSRWSTSAPRSSVPQLVERAREEKADAILVSQVVTQRDAHIFNTKEMSAAFRESYPRDRQPLLIVGGPRFDETMAGELGVDRVFARGTTPGEVASYMVDQLVTRRPGRPSSTKKVAS